MDDPRVAQLITLFERALDVPHAQRAEFIDEAVGDDAALREELSSLLEAHESATDYFDDLAEQLVSPAYTALVGAGNPESESALLPQLQTALGNTYRILEELDSGMSRVFLAEEIKLGRQVVIKVLPTAMAAGTSAERFRREIQLAARLQHPHIVPLLTSDAVDSLLYYTMPYVTGESLRARLAREGPLPIREAQRIWRDMLDALAHAHASGVIHRDIKPGTVLLSARNAFVSDFGIARAIQAAAGDPRETAPGFSIGTPAYMAPEQVLGDRDADHRVDIYAAGLVMYEMLEGRLPFSGDSARELTLARLTEEPASVSRADCPPQLAALVMRCLAMAPAARPHAVEALLAELEAIPTSSAPVGARPRGRRRAVALGAAALAVAAASFVVTQSRNDRRVAAATTSAPSIAVLPLRNLSADPGDAALADGMTEELIAMLSRVGELRVIASTSVYAFEGRRMDVRQIAESLRVSHVLEGGLQKAGRRLRLRLRLVDARDGANLWSEVYDREMGDIFAVQDDIAWVVSRELDVRLARGGRARPGARRHTPRIEAYEWYLRGTDPTLTRTARGFQQAREHLNRAIAIDSSFASAYAELAGLYIRGTQSSPGERRDSLARAQRAALKAIALDDSLAEGHAALGWARIAYRDWAGAEAELKQALALDARARWPHEGMARVYLWTGRPTEQLRAASIGVEIDPFSVTAIRELALALAMNGRCDEAIDSLRPLKALTPPAGLAGVISGQCYAAQRRWREAIDEFRWAADQADAAMALGFLGYALARAGERDSARTILSDLLTGRKRSNGAFGIASVYAGLRDYDEAFTWLHKAVDEHSVRPYLMGPMFEELRRDARFAGVQRHMGL